MMATRCKSIYAPVRMLNRSILCMIRALTHGQLLQECVLIISAKIITGGWQGVEVDFGVSKRVP